MRLIVCFLLSLGLAGIFAKPILHLTVTTTVSSVGGKPDGTAVFHAGFDPSTGSLSNVFQTTFIEKKAQAISAQFDTFSRNFYHVVSIPDSDPTYLFSGVIVGANIDTQVPTPVLFGYALYSTISLNATGSVDYNFDDNLYFWPRDGQDGFTLIGQLTSNTYDEGFIDGFTQGNKLIYLAFLSDVNRYSVRSLSFTNPGQPIEIGKFSCGNLTVNGIANAPGGGYISLASLSQTTNEQYIAQFDAHKCNNIPTDLPQVGTLADWSYDTASNQLWVFFVDPSGNSVFYAVDAGTGKTVQKMILPGGYTIVAFDVEYTS